MALSAISNNTVNGEGIFISGMKKKKKNFEYGVWSTGECHLNIADPLKKLRISLEKNGLALLETG